MTYIHSGLVTDYDSGLKWVREGGLEESPSSSHRDEASARGRTPRQTPPEVAIAEAGIPIKSFKLTPTKLPEEGERIPNPIHPETPPRSKSPPLRDDSANSSSHLTSPSHPGSSITTDTISAPVHTRTGGDHASNTNTDKGIGSSHLSIQKQLQQSGFKTQWEHFSPPLHLMFLGSSLGNFDRADSANFLRSLPLRPGSSDTLLLGLDGRNEKRRVERAYNDPEGYTERFIMNGLDVAGNAIGPEANEQGAIELINQFEYLGRYNESVGELSPVVHVFKSSSP